MMLLTVQLLPSSSQQPKSEGCQMRDFRFIGRIMGKALMKGQTIKCMAEHLYKLILGWPLTINDLEVADEALYSNLMGLKDMGADIDKLHLDFTLAEDISGSTRTVKLVRNGSSINVTEENLPQYFEARIKYRFFGQCKYQRPYLLTP